MDLVKVSSLNNPLSVISKTTEPTTNLFNDVINSVIQSENDAKSKMSDFMGGKETEVHEVMIAAEKAKTEFQLLVELRNKTVDMYKELTRIQV